MTGPFDYSLFGLHIRSDLRLPELLAENRSTEPQVVVRLGDVPEAPDAGLFMSASGAQLTIPGIARYAIVDGSIITVDRDANVPDANVRLYLLGSAMGILLHQRGLLPLHANAVDIGGTAVAIMGASGAGKSTLAAAFHDYGLGVIADDVCAISFDPEQRPLVNPGLPRLRLWRQALELSGRDASRFQRSYAGDDSWDKFDVPLPREMAIRQPIELAGVYLLVTGERLAIEQLHGIEAIDAIFANTYRGNYVAAGGTVEHHWQSCIRLARQTPIFRLTREWGLSRVADDIPALVEHARQLRSGSETQPHKQL